MSNQWLPGMGSQGGFRIRTGQWLAWGSACRELAVVSTFGMLAGGKGISALRGFGPGDLGVFRSERPFTTCSLRCGSLCDRQERSQGSVGDIERALGGRTS